MTGQVQVVVYHLAEDPAALLRAYRESSRRMRGTAGLLSDELHRGVGDERSYAVVSRWRDWDAFAAWEGGTRHREQTAPMRPFRDHTRPRPFEVYRVTAAHGAELSPASGGGA